MSVLAKNKGSHFPARTSDLLDPSLFFSTGVFDLERDFLNWNYGSNVPSVNVVENEADYQIELAAPGLEKKDFKIEVDQKTLTISAEKKQENGLKTKKYTRQEYSYTMFSRSFQLPDNTIVDRVNAHYENGILYLTVPKKEVTVLGNKKEIKIT